MQRDDFIHLRSTPPPLRRRHPHQGSGEAVRRAGDAGGGDHRANNLFGGMEFSSTCGRLVCSRSSAASSHWRCRSRRRGEEGRSRRRADAVIVLVQNPHGYANLLRLLALAYGAESQSDPRVSLADLCGYADGLILLTGGPEGPVGRLLLEGRREAAETLVAQLREAFRDRLYVELLRHGLESEAATEPALLAIAAQGRSADCRHQRRLLHHTRHVRSARCAVVHLAEGTHWRTPTAAA